MGGGSSTPSADPLGIMPSSNSSPCPGTQRALDDRNRTIDDMRGQQARLQQQMQTEQAIAIRKQLDEEAKTAHLKKIITNDLGTAPPLTKPRQGQYYNYTQNLPDPNMPPPLNPATQELLATNPDPNNNTNSGLLSKIQFYNTYLNNYYKAFADFFKSYDANENIIHNELEPSVQKLKAGALKGGDDLTYVMLKKQNAILATQTQHNKDNYSADNQKILYQNQKISSLHTINYIMFIVYYILFSLFVLYLFFKNENATFLMKIFLTVLFGSYPFFVVYLRQYVMYLYYYWTAMIAGNPYNSYNRYTPSTLNTNLVPNT